MSELKAGRELDALVAERVMGLDVRGQAFAIYVEGEWSVHGDGDPDGWMCHAGTEPVYRPTRTYVIPEPTLDDALRMMEYGASREDCERRYAQDLEEYRRDVERWGCHHYDLAVVPEYSTSIASAWEVVEKLRRERYSVTLDGCWPGVTHDGGWVATIIPQDANEADYLPGTRAASAPLAVCLAALRAVATPTEETR